MYSGQCVNLTIYLHLVSRSRMVELHLHTPYVFTSCCLINEAQHQLYLLFLNLSGCQLSAVIIDGMEEGPNNRGTL
jgi:hypothetical protein